MALLRIGAFQESRESRTVISKRFWAWPWRLLQGVRPAGGCSVADKVLDEFWAEDLCCLDSFWAIWLRCTLNSSQELRSDRVQTMLQYLLQRALSTNMGLEGLLARIKASCPRSTKAGVNAEKLAYLGTLTQLMQRHLAAGRRDARTLPLAEMRKAGVPLDLPRSEGSHIRHCRDDQAFVMQNWHEFVRNNPDSSDQARTAERRRRLQTQWQTMGVHE